VPHATDPDYPVSIYIMQMMNKTVGWITLLLLLTVCSPLTGLANDSATTTAEKASPTVLITGSNRGIGLEFVRQYAMRGWQVIATARRPASADELQTLAETHPNVIVEQLDVTDLAGVDALAKDYLGQPVDVRINNAAISGSPSTNQQFGKVDYEYFDAFMATNVRGPLKVAEAFLPHLKESEQKKIVVISSIGGSFSSGGRESRGTMLYRSSKAALNMLMLNVAQRAKRYDVSVTLLNPGLVDTQGVLTDMNRKMQLGLTLVPVADSVAGMIQVVDAATLDTSGRFYQWTGEELGY